MNTPACDEVLERLGERLPPELAAHTASCAHCQATVEAFEWVEGSPRAPMDEAALPRIRGAVLTELAAHPTVRPWWQEALALGGLSALSSGICVVALRGHGPLVQNASSPLVLIGLGILLAVTAAVSLALAIRPPWWGGIKLAIGTCGAVGLGVVALGSGLDTGVGFWAGGSPCLLSELAVSAVPLAAALWVLAGSAPSGRRAALVGLATGTAGVFALHLHCPIGTASHLLCFHVLPWAALAALAALLRAGIPTRSYAP